MTLAQIRYNIWNLLSGGRTTHNEYYSGRQIDFQIHYYRSLLIRRQAERQRRLRAFEQFIDNFPMELYENNSNVILFKSEHKLPSTVRLRYHEPLTIVSSDSHNDIQVISYHRSSWDYYSKYSHIKPKAYIEDGYLFIEVYKRLLNSLMDQALLGKIFNTDDVAKLQNISNSTSHIYSVSLKGIFENPVDFEKLKSEIEDYQYSDDFEYPIGADNVQQITQSIMQGEGQIILQTPADLEHNNLPDRDVHGRQGE